MTKKNSQTILRAASLLFMLAVTAAIILYQLGYYDISFIDRPVSDTEKPDISASDDGDTDVTGDDVSETAAPVVDVPVGNQVQNNTSSMTTPGSVTTSGAQDGSGPSEIPVHTAFLESLDDTAAMKASGYSRTDAAYSSAQLLTRLSLATTPVNALSLSKGQTSASVYNEDTNKVETVAGTYERPVIELYMGMMFYDDGNTVGLLDDDGNLVMVGFDDYPHFSKTFKAIVGMTPSEYCRQHGSIE